MIRTPFGLLACASALTGGAALWLSWSHKWGWDAFGALALGGVLMLGQLLTGALLLYRDVRRGARKGRKRACALWLAGLVALFVAVYHIGSTASGC